MALLVPAAAPAQRSVPAAADHAVQLDSGVIDHAGSTGQVVFRTVVRVERAPWVRLFLAGTRLPTGSRLVLTGLQDRAVQRLDAAALADYGDSSCGFNGDAVRLELWAGPRTRGNRVVVERVLAGIAGVGSIQSICGASDDRQRSQDRRQGRLSSGCTGWLANSDVVVTAGHCVGTAALLLSFNVPDSARDGTIRQSAPEDQYPVLPATIRQLVAGVGADWAVARVGHNSNTGKLPGDAQGGWYEVGGVPGGALGTGIRITGYGTTDPRDHLSQVQKTHLGPLSGVGATHLSYRVDTTGGNSGSPAIHAATGRVIGIHTHGGCTVAATSSNYGTRIDRPDLTAALAALHGQPGRLEGFGTGCLGSNGKRPVLGGLGNPQIGRLGTITVDDLLPHSFGFFVFGASASRSLSGYALPFDLTVLGMVGCHQYSSAQVLLPGVSSATGSQAWIGYVPRDPNLVGSSLFGQYFSRDDGANLGKVVASNGLKITLGG